MHAQASIFDTDSFRLESNNNNEIYLEISTDALSRALKSATVSSSRPVNDRRTTELTLVSE